jgi:hypothetical protein
MPCRNFRKESYVRNGYRIVWDNICKSFLVDPCSFPSFFLIIKEAKKKTLQQRIRKNKSGIC